jgi:heme oxygenase
LPDWDQRQRGSMLADDLAMLGVRSSPSPPYAIDPDIGTILGWCYVLEGSRLGARVILHVVEASQDPKVRTATRFLRHGNAKWLWGGFKAALSRIDGDAVAIARACAAANTAFECFRASECRRSA